MYNIFIIVLVSFLIFSESYAQNQELINGRMLSKRELIEDYEILHSSLINYHPIPFMYTSESEFNAFYQGQLSLFPDSLSEREFYVVAKKLTTLIKCGHTTGNISENWTAALKGQQVLLPFEIYRVDQTAYIRNTVEDSFDFKPGDQLLSINGISIERILEQMDSIQVRDGNSQSFVEAATQVNFRMYFIYLYGSQEKYLVEHTSGAGQINQTEVTSTSKKMKEVEKPPLPDNFRVSSSNEWSVFAFDTMNNIAYLQIKSFSNRSEFKEYYNNVFLKLQEYPGSQLLIDLRDNRGGFFGNGNNLLSYLTPQKFELNFQRPKKIETKNEYAKLDKWSKWTKVAFAVKPAKHRIKGQKSLTFSYKPSEPFFAGKVKVITNGITFSQAALVASHLKEYGATMFGTETGGTEMSTNAMINYKVVLPNSSYTASIAHYQVHANPTKGEFGYGVRPDYEIVRDFNTTEDNVLTEVLNRLTQKQ